MHFKNKIRYIKYIYDLIPNLILKINLSKNNIEFIVNKNNIQKLILFLKNHSFSQFNQLVDICGIDFLGKKSTSRFSIVYNLLSLKYNFRIFVRTNIRDLEGINTVSTLFKSACWLEREVWDTFGIFFLGNKDLRRILSDYGFSSFALRKDFPQVGFVEIRYDVEKKHILYEPVEYAHEYRFFNYKNPWLQLKN